MSKFWFDFFKKGYFYPYDSEGHWHCCDCLDKGYFIEESIWGFRKVACYRCQVQKESFLKDQHFTIPPYKFNSDLNSIKKYE